MNKENLKRTIKELKEEASALINGGNSREQAEGQGILSATNRLNKILKADEENTTQISIIWSAEDIVRKLEAINVWNDAQHTLTDEEIGVILDTLKKHHDCALGITWDTLGYVVKSFITYKMREDDI